MYGSLVDHVKHDLVTNSSCDTHDVVTNRTCHTHDLVSGGSCQTFYGHW